VGREVREFKFECKFQSAPEGFSLLKHMDTESVSCVILPPDGNTQEVMYPGKGSADERRYGKSY
jgi:hypothetical protein